MREQPYKLSELTAHSPSCSGLWLLKSWKVLELTKKIGETKGNKYISIENAQHINYFYEYTVSFTVFTSMLKLCRLLR